jgi:hypothetical protein
MNICKNCSTQLQAGHKFCYGCGIRNETNEGNDFNVKCEMHPDRLADGFCIICSKPVCSDCIVKSNGKILCADPEHRMLLEEWCVVREPDSVFEAEALVRNLADGGIEGKMFSLHDHIAAHWLDENRIAVFVRKLELEKAQALLQDLNLIGNDE